MEQNKVSVTALLATFLRAYHHAHDVPRIFEDALADRLLTPAERQSFQHVVASALKELDPKLAASCQDLATAIREAMRAGAASAILLARARYVEDKLMELLPMGIGQYVVIGAGFDTFVWRYPELQQTLRVFEIDHPATQNFKRTRLSEVDLAPPANLYFVPADLERQSISTILESTPYDPQVPAYFAWPGVIPYLSRDSIRDTFRSIRTVAPHGSYLVFDYLDRDAFTPGKASHRIVRLMETTRRQGEPMISGFDPSELRDELSSAGFRLVEDLGPHDQELRYFANRTDGFRAAEHAHLVCAAVESS